MRVTRIDPSRTGSGIEQVRGPHLALYDPQVPSLHKLLLFFPGTNAKPEGSLALDTAFASWGFHAISLDYENGVAAATCSPSADILCFDHYRDAIVTGASGSSLVHVTQANSILNRTSRLLAYLAQTDPGGSWEEFLKPDGTPEWNRIVVAGHSQGTGHAAYVAKMFAVDRVLMFSGPQDWVNAQHAPAAWESRSSATAPQRFFAFLSQRDPFNSEHQRASCAVLMQKTPPETESVITGGAVTGTPQVLINDFAGADPHGSTLRPTFTFVWKYMATTPLP